MSERNEDKLISTQQMAKYFSEDIKHIRNIISKGDILSQDIRRISPILRRLLLDGDLVRIASPRIGKIKIKSPQLNEVHKFSNFNKIKFYSGGVLEFNNVKYAEIYISNKRVPVKFNENNLVDLSVDQFCNQRVINFFGNWINRRNIIQYVANVDGGVHSDPKKYNENTNKILTNLKGFVGVEVNDGFATIVQNVEINNINPNPWIKTDKMIDFSLIQLMSTAQYLEKSPQVIKLEEIIDME